MQDTFVTKGGIKVIRTREPVPLDEALADIYKHIDRAKGCILASDYDIPGRYSRWDIGFIDPPLEMTSRGRDFTFRALNDRGKVLLTMLAPAITQNDHVENHQIADGEITGRVLSMPAAVQLDCKPASMAVEVQNVAAHTVLPTELGPRHLASPEQGP